MKFFFTACVGLIKYLNNYFKRIKEFVKLKNFVLNSFNGVAPRCYVFPFRHNYTGWPIKNVPELCEPDKGLIYHILIYTQMLSNYCCAQMSNFKRLRLLCHTLRQGYDVRPVYTFCTFCSSNEGKSSIAPERLYHETSRFSKNNNGICWSFDAR